MVFKVSGIANPLKKMLASLITVISGTVPLTTTASGLLKMWTKLNAFILEST